MSEENGQATEPTEEPALEKPRVEAPAEDSRDTTRLLPRSNEEYDKVAGRIWTAAAEEAGNWGLGVMIIAWNPSGGWRSRWPAGVNQNALIGMLERCKGAICAGLDAPPPQQIQLNAPPGFKLVRDEGPAGPTPTPAPEEPAAS